MFRLPIALFCCLISVALLPAQDTRGSISGVVTDDSGAAIADARIVITNVETNVSVEARSEANGIYNALYLLPGKYRLTAEAQGFKKFLRENLELRVQDRLTVNIGMQLGALQETISVTADSPLLEVSTASSGQVVDRKRITELPLADGNPLVLVRLAPGIVVTADFSTASSLSNSGPSNFESSGSPGGNEFTMDGAPNTADRQGNGAARVGLQPPTDAVEEFKVVTASFDAQQGRTAGASVDVAVRSGTNQLHGTLYHFVRNDIFAANTFWLNRQGTDRQARRYNRYGGTVGGPVLLPKIYNGRDKTFFFAAYENIRPITPSLETLTVPTEAFRVGDFSSLANRATPLLVYDPATARRDGARIVRDPIQCNGRINVICPDRISPIARAYLSYMPLPNTNLDSATNNFIGNGPGDNKYYVFITRLDHQFNEKNRMFFRFSRSYRTELDENSAGTNNGVRINGRLGHRGNDGGVVDYVYVPSGNTILNLRASYTRFNQDRFSLSSFDANLASLGFNQQALSLFTANTLPQINITNYSSPVEPTGFLLSTPTWSLQPTVTKLWRGHSMRIGYDFRVYQENRTDQAFQAGSFNFTNDFTRATDQNPSLAVEHLQAQALAAFLLGVPTGGNLPVLASRAATAKYHGIFFQDDWKITPRLTVNLGLRYEIDLGTTERYNRLIRDFDASVTNPAEAAVRANYAASPIPEISPANFRLPGGLLFADNDNRASFRADRNNWQPRFGVAYQLNEKTAIRGGWAIFMVPFLLDGLNQNGFSRNTPLIASPDLGLTFTASLANPFPDGYVAETNRSLTSLLGQNPGLVVPTERRNGLLQRWEVSLQRELGRRWIVEAAYIGNYGYDLLTQREANPILRQFQSTAATRDQTLINLLDAPVNNPFRGVAGFEGTNLYTASVTSRRQLLRPFPQYTGLQTEFYDGSSTYHAGQFRVEKRFSQGYTFLATYAFSKYLERVTQLNPTDPNYENRLAEADSPHRLAVSGIYELPFGRGRRWGSSLRGWKEALIGGFQVQGIWQSQAGTPLTIPNVYYSGDLSRLKPKINSKTIGALGTNNILDNVFGIDIRESGFYFTDDAVRTNGELDYTKQRNDTRINLADNLRTLPSRASNLRNMPIHLLDLSVIKNFSITEQIRLQFRAEAINALNRFHFNGPVLNSRDTNFGRVTNTNTVTLPREYQLGLRLVF
jgi:hypothetical protein